LVTRSEIVKLPTTIDDLKKLYLATIKSLSEEPARINASTLDEILEELSQVDSGTERFSFLIEFISRVVNRYPSDTGRLKSLVRHNANKLLVTTIEQRLSRERRFLLSIMINPGLDAEPVPSTVDAKVLVAGTAVVIKTFPNTSANNWEDVRTVVEDIVRHSRRIVIEEYGRDEADLEIEFLLSDSFFLEAPDEFIIALSRFNKPPLGKLHPVIIRWRERILTPSEFELTPWQEAAAKVDRGKPSVIQWLDRDQCSDPATACGKCKGLVTFRFLPKEELYKVIGAGFPFVAWFRSEPADGNWDQFVAQFNQWAALHIFEHLPQKVHTIRQKKTDLGAALTLFWDDPSLCRYWTRGDVIIRETI
jgi:vWA-MoxR associated protein C-terminal domain